MSAPWLRWRHAHHVALHRGFTLIEVLIAIAMLIALVGSMFGFYFNILSSRATALTFIRQQEAATALINWLDADLTSCVAGDALSGAGVKGDSQSMRVLTRGVSANLAQRGADDPELFGDLQLAEYRFNADELRIEGRRRAISASQSSNSRAEYSPLDGFVHHLRFRYFDGESWNDSFDSLAQKKLPVAIEVAIWLNPVSDDPPVTDAKLPAINGETAELSTTGPASWNDEMGLLAGEELPPPDRVRIIVIPDAQGEANDSNLEPEAIAP